jgi:hypothetical protein
MLLQRMVPSPRVSVSDDHQVLTGFLRLIYKHPQQIHEVFIGQNPFRDSSLEVVYGRDYKDQKGTI